MTRPHDDEKTKTSDFNRITKQIQAEAGRYLAWLNSSKPLGDEFRMIKGRIVTLACQLRALPDSVQVSRQEQIEHDLSRSDQLKDIKAQLIERRRAVREERPWTRDPGWLKGFEEGTGYAFMLIDRVSLVTPQQEEDQDFSAERQGALALQL